MARVTELLHRGRPWPSWVVVLALAATAAVSALVGDWLWAAFAGVALGVAVAPAVVSGRASRMPPWEVLALPAVPLAAHPVLPSQATTVAAYLAVVGLALLVTVELTGLTDAELPPRVAVGFVVLSTMAVAAVWTILRFASDTFLGTDFLTTVDALLWNLVTATAIAIFAGPAFALYFEWLDGVELRTDEEVVT